MVSSGLGGGETDDKGGRKELSEAMETFPTLMMCRLMDHTKVCICQNSQNHLPEICMFWYVNIFLSELKKHFKSKQMQCMGLLGLGLEKKINR